MIGRDISVTTELRVGSVFAVVLPTNVVVAESDDVQPADLDGAE